MEAPTTFIKVFHLSAFLIYSFTVFYSITKVNVPLPYPEFAYAGKAKFLTQWNLCLCGAYFGLCSLLNILSVRPLRRLRDYIFCSISLPSSIFVTFLFWGLYAYNRELIFPRALEPYYPLWVNHVSHTLIAFTAIGEALLYPHKVPSRLGGLPGILTWFGSYLVWVIYLGVSRGVWVYEVLRVQSAVGVTAFLIGCSCGVFLLHFACNAFLHFLDRRHASSTKQQKRG